MTQPIEVRVTEGVGYVRYGDEATIAETQDVIPSCSVAADLDASGQIIGIEILFPSDAAIVTVARDYAHQHGLAFPLDFSGVLTGA